MIHLGTKKSLILRDLNVLDQTLMTIFSQNLEKNLDFCKHSLTSQTHNILHLNLKKKNCFQQI